MVSAESTLCTRFPGWGLQDLALAQMFARGAPTGPKSSWVQSLNPSGHHSIYIIHCRPSSVGSVNSGRVLSSAVYPPTNYLYSPAQDARQEPFDTHYSTKRNAARVRHERGRVHSTVGRRRGKPDRCNYSHSFLSFPTRYMIPYGVRYQEDPVGGMGIPWDPV